MERVPHCAMLWTANLLVPGAGLVLLGRVLAGAMFAVLWAGAAGLLLIGALVWPDAASAATVSAVAVASGLLWVAAQALLYVRERSLRRHRGSEVRDEAFRGVLIATLQARLDEAEDGCRTLLLRDPDDVEATLHLAVLARRRGRAAEAIRLLRRARFLDDAGHWDFRIQRERAVLAGQAIPGRSP